jgi:hypothetical protein
MRSVEACNSLFKKENYIMPEYRSLIFNPVIIRGLASSHQCAPADAAVEMRAR